MIRALLRAACAATLLAASVRAEPPENEAPENVVLAVRVDARPFAWRAEDNADTYRGYLVDICRDAVTRAEYHFDIVPMTATDRKVLLDGDFRVRGRDVDLVCDPTTITLARLDKLVGTPAVFTPIVFVANGSFVRHASFELRQACRVGDVAEDGSKRAMCATRPGKSKDGTDIPVVDAPPASLDCGPPREWKDGAEYFVAGRVIGTTAESTMDRAVRLGQVRLAEGQSFCSEVVPDHTTGVKGFCANRYHFYFGDLDIINAYRQALAEKGAACDLAPAERALSYEPYALLVTSDDARFRAKTIAAVYEIFSDGTASGLFDAYFPGYAKSAALSLLFRINSIPGLREPVPPSAGAPPLAMAPRAPAKVAAQLPPAGSDDATPRQ